MEDETDLRDPDLLEELVSSDGENEGSESEDSEVEPERAAADHGYNLRPKRTEAGATTAPVRNVKNAIAPGEGVEADTDRVGGRDAGDAAKRRVVNRDSPDLVVRKDGPMPKSTYARPPETREPSGKVVDRSGGVAWDIPVLRAEGRTRRASENTERKKATARRRDPSDDADPQ